MNIAILLYNEVDVLDSGGPYEVFLTASRLIERTGGDRPFNVMTVSVDGKPTTAYGGLGLIPQTSIHEAVQSDLLIVPGTIDIETATANQMLISAIAAFAHEGGEERVIASVCTGSFLLAEAGLLLNRKWTTHFEDIDLLSAKLKKDGATVCGATRDVSWVDSGSIVTGGALSSGIDMALHLVERFKGRELAEQTARQIAYHWEDNGVYDG